jgi:dimethylargininase
MNCHASKYVLVRPVPDSYDRCVRTNTEKINVDLAKAQHAEYCRTLQNLGFELIWIRGDNNLPDSCFVEDTAAIFEDKAVICNMKVKSRAEEAIEVAKALQKLKKINYVEPPATIDGGDVLKTKDNVIVGLSTRTNRKAIDQLRKILHGTNFRVSSVKLHGVLHLKSACTYLGDNCVIYSEGHFDARILRDYETITVPRNEEYAADCLALGKTVLMAKGYPKTKGRIEDRGFSVRELDVSEFRKGEGALTCLSIIL